MKTKKIKLSKLVFDPKLLYLRPINPFVVSDYRQRYRMGAPFPSLIIEQGSNRIVSGNHRGKALLKEYPPDHEIEVIVKKYACEKDRLMDFVRENAGHGMPLDSFSQKLIARALLDESATPEEIAALFNFPVKKIIKMGESVVAVIGADGTREEFMPIKGHGPWHRTINQVEYQVHFKQDLGISPARLAAQLTRWLRNGWIEFTEGNLAILQELQTELMAFLTSGIGAPQPVGKEDKTGEVALAGQ